MQPLTNEQIRAVIARGKLKDTIFKGLGLFCLSIALLVIVALIADMVIKGSDRFTLDFFLNFASRRATQAGILSARWRRTRRGRRSRTTGPTSARPAWSGRATGRRGGSCQPRRGR